MADKKKPLILTLDPVETLGGAAGEAPTAAPPPVAPSAAQAAPEATRPGRALFRSPPAEPAPTLAAAAKAPAAAGPSSAPRGAADKAKPPTAPARPPRRASSEAAPALARWAYPSAWAAAILWAGCLTTFVLGYERGAPAFGFGPFRWSVAAGLAVLPALLMLVFAYMVRQSARLADEARRTRALADELSLPATVAAARAGGAISVMREEIARAQAAADEAGRRMAALHASLAEETRLVSEAAEKAERAASRLGGRLQSERAELGSLSGVLDAQLASAAEGAARHARLAAEASDLAQANLQEAQAALAARTADLVTAAAEATRVAESAGSGLAGGASRLERITADLRREQRAWADAAEALLSDEADIAARLETQRARFAVSAGEAREGIDALAAAAGEGSEALRRLVSDAVGHVGTLAEAARLQAKDGADLVEAQRLALEADTRAALDRLAAAAEQARGAAAASTHRLAEEAEALGEAARLRIEALAETAFAAGQRADHAFDSRLTAAKRAIEAQATLVEDAGLRSAARIEAGVEAIRTALGEAGDLATEVEQRLGDARQAARASVAASQAPSVQAPPAPAASPRPPGQDPVVAIREPPPAPALRPALAAEPAPGLWGDAAPEPEGGPGREPSPPRLRLAVAEPETYAEDALFAPTPPAAAPEGGPSAPGEWSWKDLLATMQEEGPALDDDALADAMMSEIEAIGVDPGALLPRARIEEIARAVDAGDRSRAREAVRRLAPAAVRRLSRRVLTDKLLHAQADQYRRRYGELLREQSLGDAGGASTLLGSGPGRAYLLLDAAVGDLH